MPNHYYQGRKAEAIRNMANAFHASTSTDTPPVDPIAEYWRSRNPLLAQTAAGAATRRRTEQGLRGGIQAVGRFAKDFTLGMMPVTGDYMGAEDTGELAATGHPYLAGLSGLLTAAGAIPLARPVTRGLQRGLRALGGAMDARRARGALDDDLIPPELLGGEQPQWVEGPTPPPAAGGGAGGTPPRQPPPAPPGPAFGPEPGGHPREGMVRYLDFDPPLTSPQRWRGANDPLALEAGSAPSPEVRAAIENPLSPVDIKDPTAMTIPRDMTPAARGAQISDFTARMQRGVITRAPRDHRFVTDNVLFQQLLEDYDLRTVAQLIQDRPTNPVIQTQRMLRGMFLTEDLIDVSGAAIPRNWVQGPPSYTYNEATGKLTPMDRWALDLRPQGSVLGSNGGPLSSSLDYANYGSPAVDDLYGRVQGLMASSRMVREGRAARDLGLPTDPQVIGKLKAVDVLRMNAQVDEALPVFHFNFTEEATNRIQQVLNKWSNRVAGMGPENRFRPRPGGRTSEMAMLHEVEGALHGGYRTREEAEGALGSLLDILGDYAEHVENTMVGKTRKLSSGREVAERSDGMIRHADLVTEMLDAIQSGGIVQGRYSTDVVADLEILDEITNLFGGSTMINGIQLTGTSRMPAPQYLVNTAQLY